MSDTQLSSKSPFFVFMLESHSQWMSGTRQRLRLPRQPNNNPLSACSSLTSPKCYRVLNSFFQTAECLAHALQVLLHGLAGNRTWWRSCFDAEVVPPTCYPILLQSEHRLLVFWLICQALKKHKHLRVRLICRSFLTSSSSSSLS